MIVTRSRGGSATRASTFPTNPTCSVKRPGLMATYGRMCQGIWVIGGLRRMRNDSLLSLLPLLRLSNGKLDANLPTVWALTMGEKRMLENGTIVMATLGQTGEGADRLSFGKLREGEFYRVSGRVLSRRRAKDRQAGRHPRILASRAIRASPG